ncbi:MAG: hypothetical protein ACLQVI_03225 [Polyangiaceae bacterium]
MRTKSASKLALACALIASAAACASSTALPKNVGVAVSAAPTPLPTSALPPAKDPPPPGVESHPLAGVPDGSIGPFLARRGDVVMGAYIGTTAEGARRVVSVPLSANGETRTDPRVSATVAADATMLVVRPSAGAKPGFIAAWTYLTDRGEALAVVGIADDGHARSDAIELSHTTDDIVWIDVVPTPRGAIALWVEQPHGGGANLLAAALGSDGAMRGVPARVARGVTGWQVVPTADGVGLALVTRAGAGDKNGSEVAWQPLDADARATGGPVVVAAGLRIAGDVDAVRVGDQILLAWTDASQPDPQPMLASIDAAAHLHGPKRAIEGGFGGSLVGLAAGPAGAVVAWEEPFRRGRSSKRITLARVDPAGPAVDATTELPLDLQGRGVPEIAGLADGFAFLAPARVCAANAPCDDPPVVPTYVRLDAKLAVTQVEPLRLGVLRDRASAGWGLACDGGKTCLVLAAAPSAEDPSQRVAAVNLPLRTTVYRPPTALPPPRGAPVVESLDTIASGQPFADLASARLGEGTVIAVLASANDQTAKRDDDGTIAIHVFDGSGAAVAPPQQITKRALAIGGVAIATTDRPDDGAAVAWVARDAGDPQVHVARVDRHGKLVHDVQLTNAKGDATDVAIAWSGGGAGGGGDKWIVAWVDTRDGNGEVYATTLDRDGRNVGHGQRITNAPGDASDVALLAVPDAPGVWLAWADPRESPLDGFADIYVTTLRPRDASRAGNEVRVLATAAHSRSPALGATGKDVAVGWIEEAPMGADATRTRAYGAMLAWLGPGGIPASEPQRLPVTGDGFATAIALDGAGTHGTLHTMLARAASDMMVLDALDLERESRDPVTPFPIITLDGPPSLDVALGLTGDALFFNDESADADVRRIRRATVRWRR